MPRPIHQFKDYQNNIVKVGDEVVYAQSIQYIEVGVVLSITPKMVTIKGSYSKKYHDAVLKL